MILLCPIGFMLLGFFSATRGLFIDFALLVPYYRHTPVIVICILGILSFCCIIHIHKSAISYALLRAVKAAVTISIRNFWFSAPRFVISART